MKDQSFVEYYHSVGDFYKVTNNRVVESVNPFCLALQKRVFECWQSFCEFEPCRQEEYEAARAQVLNLLGLSDTCAEHLAMIATYEEEQTNRYACLPF